MINPAYRTCPLAALLRPALTWCAAFFALAGVSSALSGPSRAEGPSEDPENLLLSFDATGVFGTLNVNGPVDQRGAFFQSLGTNGRTCATCHVAGQALSLSAKGIQARFREMTGRDPLFAAVDGANSPKARSGKATNHSLLLRHGLIRVFLPLPANAQFAVSVIHDPYGCALVPTHGGPAVISVYRRPLPTTNLNFLSTLMFDGRETHSPLNNGQTFGQNLSADLPQQALDAVMIHAQGIKPPTASQLADIVNFERGLVTAQVYDWNAGSLSARSTSAGPSTWRARSIIRVSMTRWAPIPRVRLSARNP